MWVVINNPDMSQEGMAGQTESGSGGYGESQEEQFTEKYGMSIAAIFVGLIVTHLPFISVVNLVPMFKEVVLGAIAVAALTSLTEAGDGAKHALIAGMTAAVLFNIIWIPGSIVLGGALTAASGGAAAGAAAVGGGILSGLGWLSNFIGLVLFSPIGYAVGGVVGSFLN